MGDRTSRRLTIIPVIHLHGTCLFLPWRGSQGLRCSTHCWSVVSYQCSSHSAFSLRVRQILFTGQGSFWLNLGPSEAGLILGDGGLETFKVSLLHSLLHLLPGRFLKLIFMSLREVIKLSSELSLELPNMVQQAPYLVLVLSQDPINDLLK